MAVGEVAGVSEERAYGTAGLFDLPEGVAAMGYVAEGVEGTDLGEAGRGLFG